MMFLIAALCLGIIIDSARSLWEPDEMESIPLTTLYTRYKARELWKRQRNVLVALTVFVVLIILFLV